MDKFFKDIIEGNIKECIYYKSYNEQLKSEGLEHLDHIYHDFEEENSFILVTLKNDEKYQVIANNFNEYSSFSIQEINTDPKCYVCEDIEQEFKKYLLQVLKITWVFHSLDKDANCIGAPNPSFINDKINCCYHKVVTLEFDTIEEKQKYIDEYHDKHSYILFMKDDRVVYKKINNVINPYELIFKSRFGMFEFISGRQYFYDLNGSTNFGTDQMITGHYVKLNYVVNQHIIKYKNKERV